MTETRHPDLAHTLVLDAPLEVVWNAWTDPKALARWFPLEAGVDLASGGWVEWRWGDLKWKLDIEALDAPTHLRLRDLSGPRGNHPCYIDIDLEASAGKTTLRLVHSGFGEGADWDELYDGTRVGWRDELYSLAHYLHRHRDHRRWISMLTAPLGSVPAQALGPLLGANPVGPGPIQIGQGETAASVEVVTVDPGRAVLAVVPAWSDGLFRVHVYDGLAYVSLCTYGASEATHAVLERAWSARLAQFSDGPVRCARGGG